MILKRTIVMLIAIMVISAPAFAGLLNGTFDSGLAVGGSHTTTGQITNWNIYDEHATQSDHSVAYGVAATFTKWTMTMNGTSGNAAIIQEKGCSSNGGYFGIYQTVATVPGHTYILKSMINSMSNLSKSSSTMWGYQLFVVDGAGFTRPDTTAAYAKGQSDNMSDTGSTGAGGVVGGWVQKTTSFTAASENTTLAWLGFVRSNSADSKGQLFAVDNVTIPEPSSILALGAGLLGLVGIIRRKR